MGSVIRLQAEAPAGSSHASGPADPHTVDVQRVQDAFEKVLRLPVTARVRESGESEPSLRALPALLTNMVSLPVPRTHVSCILLSLFMMVTVICRLRATNRVGQASTSSTCHYMRLTPSPHLACTGRCQAAGLHRSGGAAAAGGRRAASGGGALRPEPAVDAAS